MTHRTQTSAHDRLTHFVIAVLVLSSAGTRARAQDFTVLRPAPVAPVRPVTDDYFGTKVVDIAEDTAHLQFTGAEVAGLPQALIQAHQRTANGNVILAPIAANDNRHPAGRLRGSVLQIALEARMGAWFPEGPGGKSLDVAAFAEVGRELQNPGPLIRVAVGTQVRATVRNALDQPMTLYGFGATVRGAGDSVILAPGESRELRFVATTPGTYYYAGKTSRGPSWIA